MLPGFRIRIQVRASRHQKSLLRGLMELSKSQIDRNEFKNRTPRRHRFYRTLRCGRTHHTDTVSKPTSQNINPYSFFCGPACTVPPTLSLLYHLLSSILDISSHPPGDKPWGQSPHIVCHHYPLLSGIMSLAAQKDAGLRHITVPLPLRCLSFMNRDDASIQRPWAQQQSRWWWQRRRPWCPQGRLQHRLNPPEVQLLRKSRESKIISFRSVSINMNIQDCLSIAA